MKLKPFTVDLILAEARAYYTNMFGFGLAPASEAETICQLANQMRS